MTHVPRTKCEQCSRHLYSPNPFREFIAKHMDVSDPCGFSRAIQGYIRAQRAAGLTKGEIGQITMMPCDRCQQATFAIEIIARSEWDGVQ